MLFMKKFKTLTYLLLLGLHAFPSHAYVYYMDDGEVREREYDEILLYYKASNKIIPKTCEKQQIRFEFIEGDPSYSVVTYDGKRWVYKDSLVSYDSDSEETTVSASSENGIVIRHIPHDKGSKNGILIIYCK